MNRTILLILLSLILFLVLGFGSCHFGNKICGNTGADKTSAAPATSGANSYCGPWSISDTNLEQNAQTYIRFARNEYKEAFYSDDVSNLISETAEHLIANPERALTVVGVYGDSESNEESLLQNLGMARAETIKDLLEGFGVPVANLNTDSDLVEEGGFISDTLCHGIEFQFGDAGGNDNRIGTIGERLSADPIRLYFDTDAKEPNLDAQNRQDLADIMFYLDNVPGSTIEVSGHTDNIGKGNDRLSRKRAENTAEYLTRKGGIDADRMSTKGYADSQPISSNDTEDGRAENRRVEVILLN